MGTNADHDPSAVARHEVSRRIDAILDAGQQPSTGLLRDEYLFFAERNRDLVLGFSARVRKLLAGLVVGLLVLGVFTALLTLQGASLETRTCGIQNTGLKAQPHLTSIMKDVGKIVEPLPGEAPPPLPLLEPVKNLRRELAVYVYFESHQPPGRKC